MILFDMDEQAGCHGQVQLYAGSGYRATFLSNEERQAILENEMLPLLRDCDLDGALSVALERVDASATPEHAATLEGGRQSNAGLGLVGAPLAFLLLVGWAGSSWLRYGKDPIYLDDASIHTSAPPAELTPAAGALPVDGRSSRRMLTTAMLHLASRGELAARTMPGAMLYAMLAAYKRTLHKTMEQARSMDQVVAAAAADPAAASEHPL